MKMFTKICLDTNATLKKIKHNEVKRKTKLIIRIIIKLKLMYMHEY